MEIYSSKMSFRKTFYRFTAHSNVIKKPIKRKTAGQRNTKTRVNALQPRQGARKKKNNVIICERSEKYKDDQINKVNDNKIQTKRLHKRQSTHFTTKSNQLTNRARPQRNHSSVYVCVGMIELDGRKVKTKSTAACWEGRKRTETEAGWLQTEEEQKVELEMSLRSRNEKENVFKNVLHLTGWESERRQRSNYRFGSKKGQNITTEE